MVGSALAISIVPLACRYIRFLAGGNGTVRALLQRVPDRGTECLIAKFHRTLPAPLFSLSFVGGMCKSVLFL